VKWENIVNCVDIKTEAVKPFNGTKMFLSTGALDGNTVVVSKLIQVTYDNRPSRANLIVHEGDIIFAKMQNTKKVLQITKENESLIVSTGFFVVRPRSSLDGEYLFEYLNSDLFNSQKDKFCTGATQKALTNAGLKEILIPLPDIETQKKVAGALKRIRLLIEKRKEQIAVLDKLAKDTFIDMFGDPFTNPMGWEKKRIDEFATVKTGGTPSRSVPSYWGGTIPWVKTGEIQRNVIMDTEEFITEEAVANSNAKIVPRDTILIAMYGQGKTRGMAAKLGINAAINQACAAILPNDSYNTDYLLFLLFQSYESLRAMGRGGNQPNLNLGMIKSYDVIFPDIVFQNEFSKKYSAIEDQKSRLKASLIELEKTYESIMQKAFNGELFN